MYSPFVDDEGSKGKVFHWKSSHVLENVPDFQSKRKIPSQRSFVPLFWNDFEDLKHSDYTAHLLIQQQTRNYAFAVKDAIMLLKSATECFTEGVTIWHGSSVPFAQDPHELTQYGNKVLLTSEAIKKIQLEDAWLFWTCGQRECILNLLISLSKGTVKLRRKLGRIRGTLGDRVANIRKVLIKCGCETSESENLVPPDMFYQWTQEDAKLLKRDRVEDGLYSKLEKGPPKSKGLKYTVKQTVETLMRRIPPKMKPFSTKNLSRAVSEESVISPRLQSTKGYYQMRKDIEILHKSDRTKESESVYEGSLTGLKVTPASSKSLIDTRGYGTPKVSQKHLDMIASNVTLPRFSVPNNFYDQQHEFSLGENLNSDHDKILDQNFIWNSDHNHSDHSKDFDRQNFANENVSSSMKSSSSNGEVRNAPTQNCNEFFDKQKGTEMVPTTSSSPTVEEETKAHELSIQEGPSIGDRSPESLPGPRKCVSDEMGNQITVVKTLNEDLHGIVERTIDIVRGVERYWYNPPQQMIQSKSKSLTELYQLVDYIAETAKLTENPAFASRLYQEDKDEIVSVLDPVFRELTACYVSLCDLHDLVGVDEKYLKELVSGFPKGNLVIKDWVSDPAIYEGLQGVEQFTDCELDVEELFA